ncbi:DUF7410 domain-containing protein [Halobaculum magnesiiphilum]|uniref:DUF7410 domain-containing protein n=1 Tax=Halobaculum magnesiiphilum TaxID=1017351 RepID=UPI001CEDF1DC|nr:hypothetical protein [Halobaculum magnesiiphilum]
MSRDHAAGDDAGTDGARRGDGTTTGDGAAVPDVEDAGDATDTPEARDPAADRYEVPPGETAFACPRCGRPFARERHRDLHLGQAHADLDDEERTAYEVARDEETDDLRRFRIVSLGMLVVLYFGFLFLYAIAG